MTEAPTGRAPSRFDYVAYDATAAGKQAKLKTAAQAVEAAIEKLEESRAAMLEEIEALPDNPHRERAEAMLNEATGPEIGEALALLEQSYMWCGKAVRDEQIERNGSAPLQEGRSNS